MYIHKKQRIWTKEVSELYRKKFYEHILALDWQNSWKIETLDHRRRINTEEKAKVIASTVLGGT